MFSGRTYEDLADTSKHVQAIYKTWCCPVVSICLRIQTITFEIGQKSLTADQTIASNLGDNVRKVDDSVRILTIASEFDDCIRSRTEASKKGR